MLETLVFCFIGCIYNKKAKNMNYKEQYQKRKARRSAAKNFNVYGILVGETYGNYKVIEKIKIPKKVSRGNGVYVTCNATAWKCEYIPSGEIKVVTTGYLSEFKQKSLEDKVLTELVKNNKHQKGFRNFLYKTSKRNALTRNHDFKLTQDEYEEIIFKDCYYCGEHPKSMTNEQIKNRGNMNEPPLFYNGIDRIDSNVGYIKENCVPCCPMCNYMKRIYTQKDFYNQITKIYKHLNLGSTTIEQVSK